MDSDVYKTIETKIWDVLTFENIHVKYNNKYLLHVVNNALFSFNALGCLYNTRDEDLGGLTFDNILSNTITNIHYMLLIMHYSFSTH